MRDLEGRRINRRYRILGQLGEGGMGTVYLVADELRGDARVALKVIGTDRVQTRAALLHFKQEFETLSQLMHPNIARVYDFGVVDTVEGAGEAQSSAEAPRHFFTSEFVDGVDLYRFAPGAEISVLFELAVETLRALAYVHSRGVIHYDVKPSNILVTGAPAEPHVKLLDFGLTGGRHEKLDAIRGTIRYVAPEIARGGPVDERADLYSLGVTLYQVTTRVLPFDGASTLEIVRKHLEETPVPPRALRRDLPPGLEELILRLMAKEPADRYRGAEEAIRAVARITGRPFAVETAETRRARVLLGRFLGRGAALSRARSLASLGEGAPPGPALLIVSGDGGMGRTRFLRELKATLQLGLEGQAVLAGEAGAGAWSPWPTILRQGRRIAEALPGGLEILERHEAALTALERPSPGTGEPDEARRTPGASGGPGADATGAPTTIEGGDEARAAFLAGAASFLVALARLRPLVLLLDDLDLADRNALELLELLLRGLGEPGAPRRALIVSAVRTGDGGLPPPFSELGPEGGVEEVRLPPLAPPEVEALLRSMLPEGALDAELIARVADETGGNPFFVTELARAIGDSAEPDPGIEPSPVTPPPSGRPARPAAREAPGPATGSPPDAAGRSWTLPATVGEALARRIERVPEGARRALDALAILRRPARAETVAALLSDPAERTIAALRELERRGLCRSEDGTQGEPVYRLSGSRLAELAEKSLDAERAAELRRAAIRVLEAELASGGFADPEALSEYARAVGDRARAARYALLAAERARVVYANERAHACLTRAIEAAEGPEPLLDAETLGGAFLGRGEVAMLMGRNEAALRDFERYVELFPLSPRGYLSVGRARAALGGAPLAREAFLAALERARVAKGRAIEAEALRELGNLEVGQGRYEGALSRFEEARQALAGVAEARVLGRVLRDLSACLFEQGAYERALACARESLAIERREGDSLGVARTLRSISQILYYRGDYDEAVAAAREAIQKSEEVGQKAGVAAAENQVGHILHAWGRVEEARSSYERALATWRRIGDRSGVATILNNLGCIAETLGDFRAAAERYEEAARHFEAIGHRGAVALAHANLASALSWLGRLDEAEAQASRSLVLASSVGNRRVEIEAKRARAEVRERRGDLRGARESALEATREARAIGNRSCLAHTLRALGAAARALGRGREAREALEESLLIAEELRERSAIAAAHLELGRLATEEGRFGPAFDSLERARATAQKAEDRTMGLLVSLAESALLRATGESGRAELAAEEAHAGARELSMGAVLAETALELALAREASGRDAEAEALREEAKREAAARGQALLLARVTLPVKRATQVPDATGALLELAATQKTAAELGAAPLELEARLCRAEIAEASGDAGTALVETQAALEIARDLGSLGGERRANAALARLHDGLGDRPAAARHYRRAIELAKDAWFELKVGLRASFLRQAEIVALEKRAREFVAAGAASPDLAGGTEAEKDDGPAARALGVEARSTRDALSPASSHAYFLRRLDEEIARARRQDRTLAVLRLSVDGFRAISEVHGGRVARALLFGIGDAIVKNLREVDICARFFSDEFEVLLVDTDADGALLTASRLGRAVEAMKLEVDGAPAGLTLSIGVVAYPRDCPERPPAPGGAPVAGDELPLPGPSARLLLRADEALAAARAEGPGGVRRLPDHAPAKEPAGRDEGIERMLLTREGRALLAITNRLLATDLELENLLDLACAVTCEATKAERGFIMLRDQDGRLRVRSGKGFEPGTTGGDAYRVSYGIAERVARTGEPLLIAEATEDDRVRELRSVMELRLRSILCAPLGPKGRSEGDGEPIGVVYVDHSSIARKFGPQDLHFLVAIAEKIAPLIASGKKLSEREDELEAVRAKLDQAPVERVETKYSYDKIIGRSAAMQRVFHLLDRVVGTSHPVVIHGESGTGKELVARAIHYNGPRKLKPFVAENCAALSETLLEAELFGHVKGAFTGAERDHKGLFELASGGTLFLDEIGDMSERMQKKLLRVLQEGEVRPVGGKRLVKIDVRIISASNKELRALMEEGRFREDLYYRLNVITVTLPPLRDRREDIPLLLDHFLKKAVRASGKPKQVAKEVMGLLMEYDWPGNVRELENEVVRMVAMSDDVIDAAAVSPKLRETAKPRAQAQASILEAYRGKTLREVEDEVVKEIILRTLEQTNWHRTQAAEILGLPTSTLFNKMRRLGIG